ncbi:MAG: hypothetical protein A3D65_03905 [Candidatus Lloydbacteria bacterium RIFCSPHIGHO2_02_FULL_50_13]|uniref:Toxin HicA n=1 Tax=Candidatus Lloydbacteria bacterium RIFCSPHIGHO2_02_FULL_50_13 TaxID=1798661 RepID=A0A1G2D472_9BACT|nr:MAG: hypothetical protein A3D65_03905 [Candidatus Lloydbacteria bacterium RIFCSPHIGHO2_02_FULL_50_13]
MARLVPISAKKLIKILHHLGFQEIRRKGSHRFFLYPQAKKTTVVPDHGSTDIPVGLLSDILKDIDVTSREFEDLRKL